MTRVIYDKRVWNRKNYFEICQFNKKMLYIPATENVFLFLFPTLEDPCQKKF